MLSYSQGKKTKQKQNADNFQFEKEREEAKLVNS